MSGHTEDSDPEAERLSAMLAMDSWDTTLNYQRTPYKWSQAAAAPAAMQEPGSGVSPNHPHASALASAAEGFHVTEGSFNTICNLATVSGGASSLSSRNFGSVGIIADPEAANQGAHTLPSAHADNAAEPGFSLRAPPSYNPLTQPLPPSGSRQQHQQHQQHQQQQRQQQPHEEQEDQLLQQLYDYTERRAASMLDDFDNQDQLLDYVNRLNELYRTANLEASHLMQCESSATKALALSNQQFAMLSEMHPQAIAPQRAPAPAAPQQQRATRTQTSATPEPSVPFGARQNEGWPTNTAVPHGVSVQARSTPQALPMQEAPFLPQQLQQQLPACVQQQQMFARQADGRVSRAELEAQLAIERAKWEEPLQVWKDHCTTAVREAATEKHLKNVAEAECAKLHQLVVGTQDVMAAALSGTVLPPETLPRQVAFLQQSMVSAFEMRDAAEEARADAVEKLRSLETDSATAADKISRLEATLDQVRQLRIQASAAAEVAEEKALILSRRVQQLEALQVAL